MLRVSRQMVGRTMKTAVARGPVSTHALTSKGDLCIDLDGSSPILERSFPKAPNTRSLILNRPKALHALTAQMCSAIYNRILQFENSEDIKCVILSSRGTPGRAFCAGGDVRSMYYAGKAGDFHRTTDLFRREYSMNSLLGNLENTSVVSVMDGIVMGGGAGLAVHGKYRVATENTVFAMPECAIGLHPDIGASHMLPRLPNGLGMYLGLTGARLIGWDVVQAGIATHFVPGNSVHALIERLQSIPLKEQSDVSSALHEFKATLAPKNPLPQAKVIEDTFTLGSVEEIMERLQHHRQTGTSEVVNFATSALEQIQAGSPTSVKVAFESMTRGKAMTLDECLKMEFRLTLRMTRRSDFYAGVGSALITKDRNPRWEPASLASVTKDDMKKLFEPLQTDLKIPELDLRHEKRSQREQPKARL